jgi:hypothetical protein
MYVKKKNNISRPRTTSIWMPPEGESLETIESIRNSKRKAAELADTTLSLINSEALDTAGSYYLKALEEVGKIKILQAWRGNEIATYVEDEDGVRQKTRDSRIQAALDHLRREHDVSYVVKNGTQFVIRNDIPGTELKREVVYLKTKLAFL